MPLLIVALAVALLLVLMTKFKLNGFVSLLVVSVLVAGWGAATGMLTLEGKPATIAEIPKIIGAGIGGQLEETLAVIGLGAMIGRILGDAGAAQRIALRVVDLLGEKRVQWAMVITSMLIGVTMFYEAAFVIVVPIAFTLVRATRTNLLWVGLPMSISLSTMHSFLPPHPGPTAAAGIYEASPGLALLYGLFIAVPAGALVAMVWPRLAFVKKMNPSIPQGMISDKQFEDHEMPSMGRSLLVALLPVIMIAGAEIFIMAGPEGAVMDAVTFIGSPMVALLITLLVAIVVFGPLSGRPLAEVATSMSESARAMAMIIMVIAAGGAFKEVLVSTGIAQYIADMTAGWPVHPIILVWVTAVILRVALGSASVAVTTAAGIAAPLVASSGVSPELMVLATACGSIAVSHVNDPGFWMFKEYFNLSVMETIRARTTYTTVLSVLGLGGVLLLNLVVPA
ncbi:gluconate:H+ symporter [Kocuria massiliensis]|uniref:gluconate:H+ symporter n=1 Tax=Kocuria massiliensis TaxID=1926282 RepID=UPI0022B99EC1|nr:gluconate:H+ symporter [Kocuria massiliensis]